LTRRVPETQTGAVAYNSQSGAEVCSRAVLVAPGAFLTQPPEEQDHDQSRSRALIGLVIVAVLVVAAVYLVHALRQESQLEDCLMSGRSNCAPIEVPSANR
jgi:hypothetical protein